MKWALLWGISWYLIEPLCGITTQPFLKHRRFTGDWEKKSKNETWPEGCLSQEQFCFTAAPCLSPVPLNMCSFLFILVRSVCICSGLMCPLHSWYWWKTFFSLVQLFWGRLTRVALFGLRGCRNANHAHLEALNFQPEKPIYPHRCPHLMRNL